MNGTTSTTKQARRGGATLRRMGAGSALAVALVAAGASPALAGTGQPAGTHNAVGARSKGTHVATRTRVAVRLGPAITIVRSAGVITVVR